jgi:hypothetical protein
VRTCRRAASGLCIICIPAVFERCLSEARQRRIRVPELDADYDPQGLAVDDGAIYVSAYRSDSLGVRRDITYR